jgi:hypothetical protein
MTFTFEIQSGGYVRGDVLYVFGAVYLGNHT